MARRGSESYAVRPEPSAAITKTCADSERNGHSINI